MDNKTKTTPRKRFSIDGTTHRIVHFETVRRAISSENIKASDAQVFDHLLMFFLDAQREKKMSKSPEKEYNA